MNVVRGPFTGASVFLYSVFVAATAAYSGDNVKVSIGGYVDAHCTMVSRSATTRYVDLRSSGSDTIEFDVDCNMPVSISVSGKNGMFSVSPEKAPEHSADFVDFVDYRAGFTLPLSGRLWAISSIDTGAGETFVPTATDQRETPPFDTILALTVDWDAPAGDLVAGTYDETITVTIIGRD